MKDFMYSYPAKVYFGDGVAEKALQTELAGTGGLCEGDWLAIYLYGNGTYGSECITKSGRYL